MKATALIAAAALMCGTAAFAQQQDSKAARGDDTRAEQQDHGSAGNKMSNGLHRLGEKTRHAMHAIGNKLHHVAHNDRSNDTRAMGASGDRDSGRQSRMDQAYANWQSKHGKAEQNNR